MDELEALFGSWGGTVVECRVLRTDSSRDRGNGAGALIRMSTVEEAAEAVARMHGQRMESDLPPLVVRYADTPEQKQRKAARAGFIQHDQHQPRFNTAYSVSSSRSGSGLPPFPPNQQRSPSYSDRNRHGGGSGVTAGYSQGGYQASPPPPPPPQLHAMQRHGSISTPQQQPYYQSPPSTGGATSQS